MSFPIIGGKHVWNEWAGYGSSNWYMWFMAPYGSWLYAGFIKDFQIEFKKIDIGGDQDYPMYDWDLTDTTTGPDAAFPYEVPHITNLAHGLGMGCIREDGGTPYLYLLGRSNPTVTDPATILRRFSEVDGFDEVDSGKVLIGPLTTDPISSEDVVGVEIIPGEAIYVLLNNDTADFRMYRYPDDGVWDGSDVIIGATATEVVDLSPAYIANNTLSRIRGIATASDGNILVFANTGANSTETKVFKFHKTTLSYIGVTTWTPNVVASQFAYLVQSSEVFLYFEGLEQASTTDQLNSVYYDHGTNVPDVLNSNFIIADNLTSFGDDEAILLRYQARDAFNAPVANTPTKFIISGVSENPINWTDRTGAIRDTDVGDFFITDEEDPDHKDPVSVSALVDTDAGGIALAYYKPMRTGSGTKTDTINVFCPASI